MDISGKTLAAVGLLFVGAAFIPQTRELGWAGLRGLAQGLGVNVMTNRCAAAETHWRSAEAIGSLDALVDHIERFGSCPFVGLARARIASLTSATPPTPRGPIASPQSLSQLDHPDCPRVTDAVPLGANAAVCQPGDTQYRWAGRTNWCMHPRPSSESYLCHNLGTGMLSWYTP